MVVHRLHVLMVCGLVMVGICPIASSDDVPSSLKSNAPSESALQKESALQEIHQIRQRLGGSVLKGSLLDKAGGKSNLLFDAGLRDRFGLPQQATAGAATAKSKLPAEASQPDVRTNPHIVGTLRSHSTELDRIANEIESLREYKNADSLRETANQLRHIAREFDTARTSAVRDDSFNAKH